MTLQEMKNYFYLLVGLICCVTVIVIIGFCASRNMDKEKIVLAANEYISSGIHKVVPASLQRSSPYISATFDTGLGNLMFQFASLVGIADESYMTPVVPNNCKLNAIFQLQVEKWNDTRPGLEWGKIVEHRASTFDPILSKLYINQNVELVGYFQSWLYFKNVQHEVRKNFQFNAQTEDKVQDFFRQNVNKILQKHAENETLFIGVHIRRGDMLDSDKIQYGYTVADVEYLEKAVFHYERKFPDKNLLFIVCSDDVIWARRNFPSRRRHVVFCHGKDAHVDLCLLRHCHHSIITAGTFGWWAGWLAGGHVTYFKDYPRNKSRLSKSFSADKEDYYPPHWVGL